MQNNTLSIFHPGLNSQPAALHSFTGVNINNHVSRREGNEVDGGPVWCFSTVCLGRVFMARNCAKMI